MATSERPPARERRPPVVPLGLAVILGACGGGALAPKGQEAHRIAGLWWALFAVGAVVFVGVLVVLAIALRRGEGSADDAPASEEGSGSGLVVWGGIAMPAAVLLVVVVVAIGVARDLRQDGGGDLLRIEVTGHQFWWDVVYPDHDVRTANELHLPVGEPVELVLRAHDVIHSLWIPQLAGKIDLVPGHTNRLRVEATEAGDLSGYCAEFCGLQHTNMRISVTAHAGADFEEWLAHRSGPAVRPEGEPAIEGLRVFSERCATCHRVAGVGADGEIGPDLTHVASRSVLAGGALANTRGDLGGWVLDPQHAKPGSLMPPTILEPAELHALLAYLETLE